MAKRGNKNNESVPSGYRIATMDDYYGRKIIQGTEYYLTGNSHSFTVRPRLILGLVISGIQVKEEESEEDYNDNYRKVILFYINKKILWIKDTNIA